MKTTKWVLTTLAIFIVSIGIATDLPKMNIVPMSGRKAMISATNANAAFFELTVKNHSGDILYYKRSEKPLTNYQKIFDFSNIENGSYVLKIRVNKTSLAQKFQLIGDEVVPDKSQLQFAPYFSFEDNLLKFSYLNFQKENVTMKIYSTNKMIYEKKLGNDFSISDGLDLSKLEKGEYKILLYSRNHEFPYDLKKQ